MTRLPLEGTRVVTTTVIWAGTFASMFLADWGAEVIRVESLQHWQPATRGVRARPPASYLELRRGGYQTYPDKEPGDRPWNRFTLFNPHARNKLSMTVDLTKPEGMDIFRRLIKVSDVFLENNAPGAIEKLGLTYSALQELKPNIIMVSMPGFGNTGLHKYYRALGAQLEAFAGFTHLRSYPDADPTVNGPSYHCDEAAGVIGAFATVMALHYRQRTGKGSYVDLSQVESALPQLTEAIMDYSMNRRVAGPIGNRHPSAAPCGCYRCQGEDRWVTLTVLSDEEWQGLCRALGNPAWRQEERFRDSLQRWQNQDELDRLIEAWTLSRDNYEVMHLLQSEGVPAGPVIDEAQAYADPHLKERGFFEELTQVDSGTHLYPGLTWKMPTTPNQIQRAPCRLGEHNEYVYKHILGVSDEEYAQLEKKGHIGMDYAPEIP